MVDVVPPVTGSNSGAGRVNIYTVVVNVCKHSSERSFCIPLVKADQLMLTSFICSCLYRMSEYLNTLEKNSKSSRNLEYPCASAIHFDIHSAGCSLLSDVLKALAVHREIAVDRTVRELPHLVSPEACRRCRLSTPKEDYLRNSINGGIWLILEPLPRAAFLPTRRSHCETMVRVTR